MRRLPKWINRSDINYDTGRLEKALQIAWKALDEIQAGSHQPVTQSMDAISKIEKLGGSNGQQAKSRK